METLEFPNRITIELTNRCNVSCTFCNRQKVDMEIGDMEPALYYKIIDEAAEHLPVKLVLFFRGESLLVPDLVKYIRYAKGKGLGPIQLASNALALTKELAEGLIDSGIDFISFSLDTLNPEVYKESRLTGDLEASMEHVKYMGLRCREEKEAGRPAPDLQVSTIDMECYRGEQQQFITYWKQYVDVVRVYYEHDEKGHLVDEKVRRQLDLSGERKPCKKIFTDFIIYWDGRIALCNYDWEETYPIGNVKESSIIDLWMSERFQKLREMHRQAEFCNDLMCKECHHWKIHYMPQGSFGYTY